MLETLFRDVGFGVRMLRKNALVTTAAVVSLSLALGACLAAFSLVDALIFRPLPGSRSARRSSLAMCSIGSASALPLAADHVAG